MRTSIFEESNNSQVVKKASITNQQEWIQLQNASYLTGSKAITSPAGQNQTSAKNVVVPEETKSSNFKAKSVKLFYITYITLYNLYNLF